MKVLISQQQQQQQQKEQKKSNIKNDNNSTQLNSPSHNINCFSSEQTKNHRLKIKAIILYR